jgi:hypothetical protein
VNQLKAIIAACLLALWVPALSFCLMENAGWLAKNDGCCDRQSSEVSSCCTLASASYKLDESRGATAPSSSQLFVSSFDVTDMDCLPPHFARVGECGVSAPELSTSWQFSLRAAAAPRAPSLAS